VQTFFQNRRIKGVQSDELKTAEVLTPGGLKGVQLLPAKIIFRWMIKDNPELSIAMGEVGASISGYSRMSGVAMDTIRHRKKTVESNELKKG
jgi:hypothetical protein